MTQTFVIKTLGCKLNQYESQSMRELLVKNGLREVYQDEEPDWCIINTCTVTKESDRKSRNFIRKFHRTYPRARVLVTGCYVETKEDRRRILGMPGVTNVLTRSERSKLSYVLRDTSNYSVVDEAGDDDIPQSISTFSGRHRAFLKVQDGCLNTCAYCKVRFVRPNFESRPVNLILDEGRRLVRGGYKEIVLTAVQLGAYGRERGEKDGLVELLKQLVSIRGLERVRLSSIEPMDISGGLIDMLRLEPKVCPHLHIPLQSGDDLVLNRMRRPYIRSQYMDLVSRLYSVIPSFSLTTDVMVGFPGENEEQFQNTLSALEILTPLKVHGFPYSDRAPTEAFDMHPKVANSTKQDRMERLLSKSADLSMKFRDRSRGQVKNVLVEREVEPFLWEGHSQDYFLVRFRAEGNFLGECVSVEITSNKAYFSEGKVSKALTQPVEIKAVAESAI